MSAQRYAITTAKELAVPIVATGIIVDPIAVADIQAVLGAVLPNRALYEPRKGCGEGPIELARIDIGGQ
jgi:hypothetical protein